jgi:hypothetical protein
MNPVTNMSLCLLFLHSYHFLHARLTYTLKMDASGSSETLTALYRLHTAGRKHLLVPLDPPTGNRGHTGKTLFPHVNAEMWILTAVGNFCRRFGGKCHLHFQGWRTNQARKIRTLLAVCFVLVSFLTCSSSLETEINCSSETSVDF